MQALDLNRHVSSVLGDICNNTFSKKSNFQTHLVSVHEGKKPFQCDIFSGTFQSTSGLQSRIDSVQLWTKNDLKRHTSSVHEGKKAYNCVICSVSFPTKSHYGLIKGAFDQLKDYIKNTDTNINFPKYYNTKIQKLSTAPCCVNL